jgi:exosortase/archaeosortase family protein
MGALLTALLLLALVIPVSADTWTVEYGRTGEVLWITPVFPVGTYELVKAPEFIPVYLRRQTIWDFVGMYGAPAAGRPQAPLPESFPNITFTGLYDFAIVRPGDTRIATPEFAVLRRLMPRLPEVQGRVLQAKLALRHGSQHATAWGAAHLLRAIGKPVTLRGVFIDWSPFSFEVEPWCAGTNTLKLTLALGLGLAILLRPGWSRGFALVALAGLVAVEANILRVAATALVYEQMGRAAWGWKEWIGGATTAMAVLQVVGLVWVTRTRWSC